MTDTIHTETVRAILAHHEEEMAKLNKVISDRHTEIALITQELSRVREENATLRSQRYLKDVSPHKEGRVIGQQAKAKKGE